MRGQLIDLTIALLLTLLIVVTWAAIIDHRADATAAVDDPIAMLEERVAALEDQVADLAASSVDGCLAYSDFFYVLERVDGRPPRVRLPLVVWNWRAAGCGPRPVGVYGPGATRVR